MANFCYLGSMDNPFNSIITLFESLLAGADEKLLRIIDSEHSHDVCLMAPDIIIILLKKALLVSNEIDKDGPQSETLRQLGRLNVFPSMDWAITLFHKDYSLSRLSWMIRKIPISSPLKLKEDNSTKEIVYLNDIIKSSPERIKLN